MADISVLFCDVRAVSHSCNVLGKGRGPKKGGKYGLLPYPPRTNFGLKHLICVKSLVFRNSEGEHTSGGELGMGDKVVSGQRRKLHQEWLG